MRGWIAVDAVLIASDAVLIAPHEVFIAPHPLLMAPHPNPLPVRLLRSAQNVSAGRGNSHSIAPDFAPQKPVPSPRRKISIETKTYYGERVRVRGNPRPAMTVGFARGWL